jgi:hypothetical protein
MPNMFGGNKRQFQITSGMYYSDIERNGYLYSQREGKISQAGGNRTVVDKASAKMLLMPEQWKMRTSGRSI